MNGIIFANVSASVAVLFVLFLRKIFKEKLFAKVFVMLWLLIIIRLLLPFEFYSPLSIFTPEKEPVFSEVNQPIFVGNLPGGKEYLSELEQNFSSGISEEKTKISSESAFAFIWALGGISVFGFFAAKHFYSVKRILKTSEPYDVPEIYKTGKTRFYKSKNLASPLSFGILRPVIVIPEETEETELHFVLLHENTHIKDRDAVLKTLALFALSLNWFNPLVWFMVKIFERDIERYCDERVLKKIGAEKALFYANTILDFAERESLSLNYFSAASLCERVTSIMKTKHKKQNIFVSALILLAVLLTITACGTLPKAEEEPTMDGNFTELIENTEGQEDYLKIRDENAIKEAKNSSVQFVWPCSETVVTSPMGSKPNHRGIDIGVNYGSEIYAAADGEVLIAEESSEYGFYVAIGHEENFSTRYANCSEIYVKQFDKVKAGDLIGRTGSGGSSCYGLHFELSKNKTDLNPEEFILIDITGSSKPTTKTEETSPENLPEPDIDFAWPTEGGYICAKMWSYKGHTGIDIMPETGINGEIFAAADGTVVKAKWGNTGYGYHMIIDHGNGVQTCYAHCSKMYVKEGQEVKAGEPIGKVGSTGNSTGTHLHFEIRINGEYVDPEKYLPSSENG